MGLEETKEAIEAARKAFTTWGKTTAKVSSFIVGMITRDSLEFLRSIGMISY